MIILRNAAIAGGAHVMQPAVVEALLMQILDGTAAPVEILTRNICESGFHMAAWDTKRFKSGRCSYVFRFEDYSETGDIVLNK
jgi:hypothetical protein